MLTRLEMPRLSAASNDVLLLLETDKASVEVVAENDGVLTIQAEAGAVVKIGSTLLLAHTFPYHNKFLNRDF